MKLFTRAFAFLLIIGSTAHAKPAAPPATKPAPLPLLLDNEPLVSTKGAGDAGLRCQFAGKKGEFVYFFLDSLESKDGAGITIYQPGGIKWLSHPRTSNAAGELPATGLYTVVISTYKGYGGGLFLNRIKVLKAGEELVEERLFSIAYQDSYDATPNYVFKGQGLTTLTYRSLNEKVPLGISVEMMDLKTMQIRSVGSMKTNKLRESTLSVNMPPDQVLLIRASAVEPPPEVELAESAIKSRVSLKVSVKPEG